MSQQSSSKTKPYNINWGPTIYKKEFKCVSRTNAIWDALVWVSENNVRLVDIEVFDQQPHFKHIRITILYKEDERIEDYNGEPCWLSDL